MHPNCAHCLRPLFAPTVWSLSLCAPFGGSHCAHHLEALTVCTVWRLSLCAALTVRSSRCAHRLEALTVRLQEKHEKEIKLSNSKERNTFSSQCRAVCGELHPKGRTLGDARIISGLYSSNSWLIYLALKTEEAATVHREAKH